MKKRMWTIAMCVVAAVVLAHESAIGSDTPTADEAKDKAKSAEVAAAHQEKVFKPPPGFRAKKRGDKVLYCIQDSAVGTRFKTEKCYDDDQMKAYLLAREQNNRDFDQRRAICSYPRACGMP